MNKLRRKEISSIINDLIQLLLDIESSKVEDIIDKIEDIADNVQCVLDDEETYRDNVPENLQNGVRYQNSEDACDNLEDAADSLFGIEISDKKEYIVKMVSSAINSLNNAIM